MEFGACPVARHEPFVTFSLLVRDPETGQLGGAAATGSLCVGGWVLRGDPASGLSASQGSLPSVMWGIDVLALMTAGVPAPDAVARIVASDPGRGQRQLAALDPSGRSGAFTGEDASAEAGVLQAENMVAAGNMLVSDAVLSSLVSTFSSFEATLVARLFAALRAAADAGGDRRGLRSAAVIVVNSERPPLSLRIDRSDRPLDDLGDLLDEATSGDYARWVGHLPTPTAPHRAKPFEPS